MSVKAKSRGGLPKITEKEFMAQIKDLATMMRWTWFHPYDSRRSTPGLPDLLLVRPPRIIFAELKVKSGFVTPSQKQWLDLLGGCPGVETYLWTPGHWPEIQVALAPGKKESRTEFDRRVYGGK
jgi:hypothetical protein